MRYKKMPRLDVTKFNIRELIYIHYAYELELPTQVICEALSNREGTRLKKTAFYVMKKKADEKIEKQRRSRKIKNYKKSGYS